MTPIASIIGAITGCLSILGLAYLIGYWKGSVDRDLRGVKDLFKTYPIAELFTQVKTLWDIYVLDALRHRPDLASHSSSFQLRDETEAKIPEPIKKALREFPTCNPSAKAEAAGWVVVKCLGTVVVQELADTVGLTIQETVAVLSVYLQKSHNQSH